MKILTPRNNKDYYDYLTGIYGIDEKVVYDRRQFTILARLDSPFFSHSRMEKDAPKKEIRSWKWSGRRGKWVTEAVADETYCMLEVGLKWYFFKVERYLDDSLSVHLDWKIEKTKSITRYQRVGVRPMTFFKAYATYRWWTDEDLDIRVEKADAISNPILKDTPITSLISSQEIYGELCAYISSLNDVEIFDTRTDIQKAESAGFDGKTSFRNIK